MLVRGKLSKSRMLAMDFFADLLLTPQLKKHIIVNVVFRKKMKYLGLTHVEDYNIMGKPREFTIDINRNQTQEEILKTIAHELVHVRQYAMGYLNEEATMWQGRSMPRDIEYQDQPWEIEAEDVSDIIYEEYVNDRRTTCATKPRAR